MARERIVEDDSGPSTDEGGRDVEWSRAAEEWVPTVTTCHRCPRQRPRPCPSGTIVVTITSCLLVAQQPRPLHLPLRCRRRRSFCDNRLASSFRAYVPRLLCDRHRRCHHRPPVGCVRRHRQPRRTKGPGRDICLSNWSADIHHQRHHHRTLGSFRQSAVSAHSAHPQAPGKRKGWKEADW